MDTVLLRFRRHATEREYKTWMVRKFLKKCDSEFLWVAMGICCLSCLQNVLGPESWLSALLAGLNTAYLLWEIMAQRGLTAEETAARRTSMVLRARVFLQVTTCAARPYTTGYPITNFLGMCTLNGTVLSMLLIACLRLDFRHHLIYQTTAAFSMLFTSTKLPCALLMGTSGGSLVRHAAGVVDFLSKGIESVLYGWLGMEPDVGPPLMCPCLHVMAWLHVYFSLIFGSYILWKLEKRARKAFIQSLPLERRKAENLSATDDGSVALDWVNIFELIVVALLAWELNFYLVKGMEIWGG